MSQRIFENVIINPIHEVQVGHFSVVGESPIEVLKPIKEIYDHLSLPLFTGTHTAVRIFFGDLDPDLKEDLEFRKYVSLFNWNNSSHRHFYSHYCGSVSWYCESGLIPDHYRGVYTHYSDHNIFYQNGEKTETYHLPHEKEISSGLMIALGALRESGISQKELQTVLEILYSRPTQNREQANSSLLKSS